MSSISRLDTVMFGLRAAVSEELQSQRSLVMPDSVPRLSTAFGILISCRCSWIWILLRFSQRVPKNIVDNVIDYNYIVLFLLHPSIPSVCHQDLGGRSIQLPTFIDSKSKEVVSCDKCQVFFKKVLS